MFRWFTRCLPGFSTLGLLILLTFAFVDLDAASNKARRYLGWPQHGGAQATTYLPAAVTLKLSQKLFIVYALLVHLDTTFFALRLCLSLTLVRNKLQKTLRRRQIPLPEDFPPDNSISIDERTRNSPTPPYSPGSPTTKPHELSPASEVIHAIIIPNYAEDIDTLHTTLRVLASHPRARTQYEVYLAMEEKEKGSDMKAASLVSSFGNSFATVRATFHPSNLPGEIAGKSSNVSFAAREIFWCHQLNQSKLDVIITVIDSDTHLLQDYFTELRRIHHSLPESSCALYVCPIVFDRNAHDTNVLVRVADILWAAAGISSNLPWSTIHIPTSVYSLPLLLAEDVGGWDGDPTAIGEDMHMLLKTYFNSRGKLVTVPLYSAASQCNISGGECASPWRRKLLTIQARYRQAQRHMWGSLDSGYATRRVLELHSLRFAHIPLFHLLWEAHILPTHFILILLASVIYTSLMPIEQIHPSLLQTFAFTNSLRNFSFFVMQLAFVLYDRYHHLCVSTRAQDMQVAGIEETFAFRHPWQFKYLSERIVFPVSGAFYSAVPAIYAQVCHFWTDRLVYTVSLKPMRMVGDIARGVDRLA